MKYLLKNINLLNLILLAFIALFANYAVLPLLKMDLKYTLPVNKKTDINKVEGPYEREGLSFSDHIIIAEQNPFHPERIIPAMPVDKKKEKPLLRPDIVLYGTMVSEGISLAQIEDKRSPLTTQGGRKRLRVIKKGAEIEGFILKEIETDKIILVRGDEIMVVNLLSPRKKRD